MPWHKPEDFPEPPPFETWDELFPVLELFSLYSDQWRYTMDGPVALDLNVFQHHLHAQGVVGEEYEGMIHDLGIIASQALYNMKR